MKRKTETLNMRLTLNEKQIIQNRAEWNHQPVSNYLLTLAMAEARKGDNGKEEQLNEPEQV